MFKITLEAARVNAHLTLDQASDKIGVSKRTLINWEKGRTKPTRIAKNALVCAYNIPENRIFFD